MVKIMIALLILTFLPLLVQEGNAHTRLSGTWEAKWKDTVVCTLRLNPGEPISGEMVDCRMHVNENGDLQEPESTGDSDKPAPIVNAKIQGNTLTFQVNDGDEVTKFEFKLVGERSAELTFPGAPVQIKPIVFKRR